MIDINKINQEGLSAGQLADFLGDLIADSVDQKDFKTVDELLRRLNIETLDTGTLFFVCTLIQYHAKELDEYVPFLEKALSHFEMLNKITLANSCRDLIKFKTENLPNLVVRLKPYIFKD